MYNVPTQKWTNPKMDQPKNGPTQKALFLTQVID
jgi:hypothetical protein